MNNIFMTIEQMEVIDPIVLFFYLRANYINNSELRNYLDFNKNQTRRIFDRISPDTARKFNSFIDLCCRLNLAAETDPIY